MAHDLRALLGRGPLGGAVLRGARGERRLAVDRHALPVAGARAPDRPRLRAHLLVRGDGRVGPAAGRDRGVHEAPSRRGRREAAGRALAARRVLAQLPGEVPRDQRPPQADAPDLAQGRGDDRGAGPDRGARPSPPRPVQRLLLARAVRRDLHQPHAPGDVRAPHRGRGRRGSGAGHATRRRDARPRHGRAAGGVPRRPGPGRHGDAVVRRGHRVVGRARGVACARCGPPPPARGLPRDAPRARGEGPRRRRGRRPTTAAHPRRSTTS